MPPGLSLHSSVHLHADNSHTGFAPVSPATSHINHFGHGQGPHARYPAAADSGIFSHGHYGHPVLITPRPEVDRNAAPRLPDGWGLGRTPTSTFMLTPSPGPASWNRRIPPLDEQHLGAVHTSAPAAVAIPTVFQSPAHWSGRHAYQSPGVTQISVSAPTSSAAAAGTMPSPFRSPVRWSCRPPSLDGPPLRTTHASGSAPAWADPGMYPSNTGVHDRPHAPYTPAHSLPLQSVRRLSPAFQRSQFTRGSSIYPPITPSPLPLRDSHVARPWPSLLAQSLHPGLVYPSPRPHIPFPTPSPVTPSPNLDRFPLLPPFRDLTR